MECGSEDWMLGEKWYDQFFLVSLGVYDMMWGNLTGHIEEVVHLVNFLELVVSLSYFQRKQWSLISV